MYKKLDALIIAAIKKGKHPLYDSACSEESYRIADATERDAMRICDGRMTSLRKAGKIVYRTKASAGDNPPGWSVA